MTGSEKETMGDNMTAKQSVLLPGKLLCNQLPDPLGIGAETPELSWQITGHAGGAEQAFRQIRAAHSEEALEHGPLCWDSGWVEDSRTAGIPYGGPAVRARERVCWQVRVRDTEGNVSEWSNPGVFEVGLPAEEDWKGTLWCGYPQAWAGFGLLFHYTFNAEKPVARGRIYLCGLGWSEAWLNGVRLNGDAVLEPPQSNFAKSWHYRTFDVTSLLQVGKNVIAVHAGAGWYGMPKIRYRVEGDGQLLTDTHVYRKPCVWPSAVVHNSIYIGEEYDARREQPEGWNKPGKVPFPIQRGAVHVPPLSGRPRGYEEQPVRPLGEIPVRSWKKLANGHYLADFGRNFAGWCRLKLTAPAGTRIAIRFAEFVNADGTVNQLNLLTEKVEDVYIAAGKAGGESWEPHFTYHGFRFAEIEGLPAEPAADTLTGVVLHNDCPPLGTFTCSDPLWEKTVEMIRHTEESNLFAVPTDCPQRSERMGWLNDMMARCEGALYLFDESALYGKFLRDIAECQDPGTGHVPMTAPLCWDFDVDPVCSCFVDTAWNLYKFHGCRRLLDELYPNFCAWVRYMFRRSDPDGILREGNYVGDWCPPLEFNKGVDTPQNLTVSPEIVGTAVMHYAADLVVRIGRMLGKDVTVQQRLQERIRRSFLAAFRAGPGRLKEESQSGYAFAVFCGLFPEEERQAAADRLAELFEANACRHTTGNIGTKYLLEVLSEYGHAELAARLISSDQYPSWGYMLANGATTLWERWEKAEGCGMNSHNHPMLGAPCAWFFRYPAGIRTIDGEGAFHRFVLDPVFISTLDHAGADYPSSAGMIRSHWRREGGKVVYEFEIPPNSRALVRVPEGGRKEFRGGCWKLEFPA